MCRSYRQHLTCSALAACLWFMASPDAKAGIVIQANYQDAVGEGFNDQSAYNGSTLGEARKNAFEFALNIWGNALAPSYAGEKITIDAQFNSLGGTSVSPILAQSGASDFISVNSSNPLVYSEALANHLQGVDINPNTSEGFATFNSDIGVSVDTSKSWYYGTDDLAAANEYDFVTAALHEIGHVLGFEGLINSDGSYYDPTPGDASDQDLFNQYDYYVVRSSDQAILRNLSQADREQAIAGDNISWAGAQAMAANGGAPLKLHAPSTWKDGSSYSHLDEATFQFELMSPDYNDGTQQALSALTIGMMVDMGWTSAVPEPGAFAVFSILAISTGLIRRRRKTHAV